MLSKYQYKNKKDFDMIYHDLLGEVPLDSAPRPPIKDFDLVSGLVDGLIASDASTEIGTANVVDEKDVHTWAGRLALVSANN